MVPVLFVCWAIFLLASQLVCGCATFFHWLSAHQMHAGRRAPAMTALFILAIPVALLAALFIVASSNSAKVNKLAAASSNLASCLSSASASIHGGLSAFSSYHFSCWLITYASVFPRRQLVQNKNKMTSL